MRQPSLYWREQARGNSIGLAAIAVVGILIVGLAFWLRLPPLHSVPPAHTEQEYRLSHDGIVLDGSHERLFVLERWQSGSGAAVNLLIVNSEDASSRWMFPDNGQTILSRNELRTGDNAFAPVMGLVLTVSTRGTEQGRESLYYYRVGGGPAVRFLTVDSVISAQQAGTDRYLVLARNGTRTTATVYSLIDFRVLAEKPAPDVQP